jgi:hypothetical protein
MAAVNDATHSIEMVSMRQSDHAFRTGPRRSEAKWGAPEAEWPKCPLCAEIHEGCGKQYWRL